MEQNLRQGRRRPWLEELRGDPASWTLCWDVAGALSGGLQEGRLNKRQSRELCVVFCFLGSMSLLLSSVSLVKT